MRRIEHERARSHVARRKLPAIERILRVIDEREQPRAMRVFERIGRLEPFEQCAKLSALNVGLHGLDSLAERPHIATCRAYVRSR